MEKFQGKADPGQEDVILLVISKGLSDFTRNTLATIKRCGASSTICIALPRKAFGEVQTSSSDFGDVQYIFLEEICNDNFASMIQYQSFNSEYFGKFTAAKWGAIRFLLNSGFSRVTYTDVDVAWIRNPMPLLEEVLQRYEIAIQTEGTESFPPQYCTGFMSFRRSKFTLDLLDKLEKLHRRTLKAEPSVHDQTVFNRYVANSPHVMSKIWNLSELLFTNGLSARLSQNSELASILVSESSPMIFHANWTVGLENKRMLLQRTGNWLISGSPRRFSSTILSATAALFRIVAHAGGRVAQRAVKRLRLYI